jgi:hypothetical protein
MLTLAGCTTPEPTDPTPTPTSAFASEEEAFAAAEATYRAYVDALNQVDLSDPETFEPVYALTTGEANAEARQTFSQMHADGWSVGGISRPTAIRPRLAGGENLDRVEVAVCLDVSDVTLVDSGGTSMVTEDRPEVQSMLVTLVADQGVKTEMLISGFSGRDGEPTC